MPKSPSKTKPTTQRRPTKTKTKAQIAKKRTKEKNEQVRSEESEGRLRQRLLRDGGARKKKPPAGLGRCLKD